MSALTPPTNVPLDRPIWISAEIVKPGEHTSDGKDRVTAYEGRAQFHPGLQEWVNAEGYPLKPCFEATLTILVWRELETTEVAK